ncbi:MAG: nucleotidyltransferase domain-containing protein [Geodermatophilaceae bacterium]|nr:nucleotidyltransferase domain-containing protein [Geodermatophilaceae bacterium]
MSTTSALLRIRAAAQNGELDVVCTRLGIRVLTVFGSAVRGATSPRDLDIAVLYQPGGTPDDLRTLEQLSDLAGTDQIDLLVLDRATPTARRNAVVPALPLFESEPGAFASFQMAAIGEYLETDWLRALDLDLLRR